MRGNQGRNGELQDLGRLQETFKDFNRLKGKQLWLRLWSSTKSWSLLKPPEVSWKFEVSVIEISRSLQVRCFPHNRSLSYFPLIFFKKNRTLLCIQISFTCFGCFEPLEKRTSRKNSDVVRTLKKERKLLRVFTCVFRLTYSGSVVDEKKHLGEIFHQKFPRVGKFLIFWKILHLWCVHSLPVYILYLCA